MASSLRAQLAALSGTSGKHPGVSVATNKRHDEALGRGIDYSVQHGQIIWNRTDFRYRATIIHKNPKDAADIPLSTLQENCQDALTSLAELWPTLGSTASVLCGPTDASNSYIQSVLARISILLGENNDQVTTHCLHVIEYLLRRYNIHQHSMEDLLWTLFPYHQQLTNAWHRVLVLVDLASHPSYLWLRPYADPHRPAPTPRDLVTRKVQTEGPLLRRLLHMVHQTANLSAMEPENPTVPLRGWSHILGWSAVMLVDGLVWQQQRQQQDDIDRHAKVRLLVPAVRRALQGRTEEYVNWGCIVGSTMAECFDLTNSVISQWGLTLLANEAVPSLTAWSALASMLLAGQDTRRVEPESYLPLISMHHDDKNQWIGCPLPDALFDAVTPACVESLGNLQESQQWEITPLAVAVLVRALRANDANLATSLIEDDNLGPVWQRYDLVPSVVAYVVTQTLGTDGDTGATIMSNETGRTVLKSLQRRFSTAACERGLAHATKSVDEITLLPSLVKGIFTLVPEAHEVDTNVLPPRVALEHPDVAVRRRALLLVTGNERIMENGFADVHDGETLMETLVRRWSVEPDRELSRQFAKAIMQTEFSLITSHRADQQCLSILNGAYHWLDNKTMSDLLPKVVSKAVKDGAEIGANGDAMQNLRELSVALVNANKVTGSSRVLEAMEDSRFLEQLIDNSRKSRLGNSKYQLVRERAGWNLVLSLHHRKDLELPLAKLCLQVFVQAVKSRKLLQTSQLAVARKSLQAIANSISHNPTEVVESLVSLSTVSGKDISGVIDDVLRTLSLSVTDTSQRKVNPLAVILEAALRGSTSSSIKRLVRAATDIAEKHAGPSSVVIVPSVVLLTNLDKGVREAAMRLLSTVSRACGKQKIKGGLNVQSILSLLLDDESSVIQVGISLPSFFSRLTNRVDSSDIRSTFLEMTFHAALTVAPYTSTKGKGAIEYACWLRWDEQSSTREAACKILEAMETAGEASFPLLVRWEKVGYPLCKWIDQSQDTEFPSTAPLISELIARQLKGIVVSEPQVVLSSGSAGARRRSYSVGQTDDLEILSPYPKTMVETIISSIEINSPLRIKVVDTVISSKSWGDLVFPKLESDAKKQIVEALLLSSTSDHAGKLMQAARKLSLSAIETADMLKQASLSEEAFPYLALLLGYIKANVPLLLSNNDVMSPLVGQMFTTMEDLYKLKSLAEPDGLSFLLQALLTAIDKSLVQEPKNLKRERLREWTDVLLSTLDASGRPDLVVVHKTATWKIRSLCLGILTSMSNFKTNNDIVASLADLALSLASRTDSFSTDDVCAVVSVSVPLLWCSPDSPRSTTSFLMELLSKIARHGEEVCSIVVHHLLKVMSNASDIDETCQQVFPGIMASIILAMKAVVFSEKAALAMASEVLESCSTLSQFLSMSYLVESCKVVLGGLLGSQIDDKVPQGKLPAQSDIIAMVSQPLGDTTDAKSCALAFTTSTLSMVNQHVIMDQVQKVLSRRNASIATVSLQLWQNLLLIHTTAENAMESTEEKEMGPRDSWKMIAARAVDGRETVQKAVPPSVFVAAVESLLSEHVADDLRSRAFQLAAAQILLTELSDEDQVLFSELLATAATLVSDHSENVRVRQSALVYIDNAARALFQSQADGPEKAQHLVPVLSVCARVAKAVRSSTNELQNMEAGSWNLLSSLALASSTLVDRLGMKAMASLGSLLKTSLAALLQANKAILFSNSSNDELGRVQLATLTFLNVTAKAVPQAIFGHLNALLSPSVSFAGSIRQSSDLAIIASIKKLDCSITTMIPARLLIPVLVKVATGVGAREESGPETMLSVLDLLSMTVACLGPGDGRIFRSTLTKVLLKAFQYQCSFERKRRLVSKGTECMLGLVLKLSEVQFLRMYGDLSEWMRQDPDSRRYAFWSLSEALSRELKTIFLPGATMVFDEVVSDLDTFADFLSRKGSVEVVQKGKKKRKKAIEKDINLGDESLRALIPLLGMTSTLLRADAHSGGNWTRERGRYHDLLNPLARLLHSQIPEGFPLPESDLTPFEYIVEDNDRGSVVACLTALALAAGDEQLWKPVNHAVLEACGHSSRSQVRKGGLVCLQSLIQSLGEEYMVLLPECLPLLAELLEDENESIAGLARHAISTAEELLGESLENNLK